MEHHMAWRVAGAVIDVERLRADGDAVAILKPAVGSEAPAMRHAVARALLGDAIDPERVLALRPLDRNAELLGEIGDRAGMIEMAVRHQHFLNRDALAFRRGEDAVGLTAGIDDGGSLGLSAPDKRAILLKRRHRDDDALKRRAGG